MYVRCAQSLPSKHVVTVVSRLGSERHSSLYVQRHIRSDSYLLEERLGQRLARLVVTVGLW